MMSPVAGNATAEPDLGVATRRAREARLRPGHAGMYPGIRPNEWRTAASLADQVLAGQLLRGRETAWMGRVLPEAHFEFRGGKTEGGLREGLRPSKGGV